MWRDIERKRYANPSETPNVISDDSNIIKHDYARLNIICIMVVNKQIANEVRHAVDKYYRKVTNS